MHWVQRAAQKVGAKQIDNITLTASDFVASRDDDTALSASTVGEIAEAEVGEDGQLSSYKAVVLGDFAQKTGGDNSGNEVFYKFQSGGADVADTAQIRFGARFKGELGGPGITPWVPHRNQDNSDARQRKSIGPQKPPISEGRLITIMAKDETASLTVDLSESEFEQPAIGFK